MKNPFVSLERAIFTNQIKHPTSQSFDIIQWYQFISSIEEPSERDIELFNSGKFIYEQLRSLRSTFGKSSLVGISRRDSTCLAIAVANREYLMLTLKLKRKMLRERKGDYFDFTSAGDIRIASTTKDNNGDGDEYCEAIVDSLPHWLATAQSASSTATEASVDFSHAGRVAMHAFSIESGYIKFWQQCLWSGWRIRKELDVYFLEPRDQHREKLEYAWLARQQNLMQQVYVLEHSVRKAGNNFNETELALPPYRVVGVDRRPGRQLQFKFSSSNHNKQAVTDMIDEVRMLKASYVSIFLEIKLDKIGLDCIQLTYIWFTLRDVIRSLRNCSSSKLNMINDLKDVNRYCLLVRCDILYSTVARCCCLSIEDATKAIGFLAYQPSERSHFRPGLWSMPLVKLPNNKQYAICIASLEGGSPLRRIEQWLERGGVSDQLLKSTRGDKYENWVRSSVNTAISNNSLFTNARCLLHAIRPKEKIVGDIDLVLKIGQTLLIGEIKCLLTPAERIERHRYYAKLEDAAKQVLRKQEWVNDNIDMVTSMLGRAKGESWSLNTLPIIIVNQGFGFSLNIKSCLVIDFSFLRLYINGNSIAVNGAFHNAKGHSAIKSTVLYNDEHEAGANFFRTFSDPFVLQRYLNRIVAFNIGFPMSAPGNFFIESHKISGPNPALEEDRPILDMLFDGA